MKDVVGTTSEEVRMIKAIQRSVGALDNGWIGNQTLSDIAAQLGADCFPLNVELYGQPAILARDIDPLNLSGRLPENSISGSFSWQGAPCSILVRGGRVVRSMSCHYPTPRERALQDHGRRGAHRPRLLGGGAGQRRVGGRGYGIAR